MLLDIVTCTRKLAKKNPRNEIPAPGNRIHRILFPTPIKLQVNLTFTRNISSNHLPGTQPHSCHLPLTRVRLLRLSDTSLKTNTLQPRRTLQRRRSTTTSLLSSPNTATDLIVRSADDRRARELPLRHGSEAGCSCADDGVEVEAGGDGGLFRGEGDSW